MCGLALGLLHGRHVSGQVNPDPQETEKVPTPVEKEKDGSQPISETPQGEAVEGVEQEETQAPTAKEVIVTATRQSENPLDLSFTTYSVSSEKIANAHFRSTPEALREIPGIMVQKTAHGHGSPYIRGFTSFRNLFLIDGIRLNNSVFRPGPNQYWNTVDSLSLSRLEVVKGPASVLYGSDAIGGTVNAITKGPYGYGEGFQLHQRLDFRVSTGERSHTYRYEMSATWDHKFGLWLAGSFKNFGSLHAGRGTGKQSSTGYDEWDGDAKIEYFFNPDTKLVFAYQNVQQNNVPRTHRTIFAKSFDGTTIGRDRRRELDEERRLTYVQLHAENMKGFVDAMHLSLSWQELRETRDRIRSSGRRDLQGFYVGTIGFGAQFESETPIGDLTYGLEYYHDNVNSFSTRNPIQGPVADDASYTMFGLYLQDEIVVTERLDLVLGGRFNFVRAQANRIRDPFTGKRVSSSDEWDSFVGSIRFVYHLVPEHLNIYGGVSQGFRAPNLSDLTRFDSARTNEIETPSFGLDPERYLSYEIGLKAEYEKWSMQAAYFYTDIQDMIIRVPTGRIIDGDSEVTKVNAGDGFVHGLELAASYRFCPQWTAFGSISWVDGEVDTFPTASQIKRREPLDRLMPVTGQLGLRWDHPSGKYWVEGIYVTADGQDDLSTRDRADTSRIPPGGTPSYGVFSIRSGWKIRENINLTVALENITDEDYRVHGSGLNEVGRSLNIGLSIEF